MHRPQGRLDRRQFIRSSGWAAATVALGPLAAACGAGRGPSPTTTGPGHGPPPWDTLRHELSGRLVLPADAGYLVSAQLYNERFDQLRPAAIAYCAGPGDVQRAIEFARRWAVPLSARSGGHSYGGFSVGPGLVLDVTPMAGVVVGDGVARIGAGTRLVDMYAGLAARGVAVPGGSCPTVGIAGLALGGGIGVLGRKFGLTCDNLVSLQMVTADSRLLTCTPSQNEDLYWASRGGGGGNFGVATSFDFSVHPIPETALFTLAWPWAAAGDVLGAWQAWMGDAPDELWSNCQLLSQGGAGPTVKVTGVFCGGVASLSDQLQVLVRTTGPPSNRFVGPEQFMNAMMIEAGCEDLSVAQCHLPTQNPAGTLQRSTFAAKSLFIDDPLPGPGVGSVVDAVDRFQLEAPGLGGAAVFDAMGGAVAAVPPDATAFVHRHALADIQMSVGWSAGSGSAVPAPAADWLPGLADDLAPYSSGAYQNYIDPTLEDWAGAYYGANLPRLRRIKSAVDPDDVFHFAQSIPPLS